MTKAVNHSATRQHILQAALRRFAHNGYAAASVQQIVDDAKVSKPALYYYFQDKAGLFQAYRLMQAAVAGARGLPAQLVGILTTLFDYIQKNRELMRIAFATAFAAPGEVPEGLRCMEKCERNFEYVHSLIKQALAVGALDRRFRSEDLALGFYGQMNMYLVSQLVRPERRPDRPDAVRIVKLFLEGAAAKKRAKPGGGFRSQSKP
jgi:AcrR family transcriptional regulator